MAFPLSATLTHQFSPSPHTLLFSTLKRQPFLPLHSAFRLNRTRISDSSRNFPLQICCISSKNPSKESSQPAFSLRPCLSLGTKRLERALAVVLIFIQISSPLPLASFNPWFIAPAEAVLYSPDTKVPRTGELALRRAIPANTNMKTIQDSLEDLSYLLRIPQRKPYGTMESNVKKALKM